MNFGNSSSGINGSSKSKRVIFVIFGIAVIIIIFVLTNIVRKGSDLTTYTDNGFSLSYPKTYKAIDTLSSVSFIPANVSNSSESPLRITWINADVTAAKQLAYLQALKINYDESERNVSGNSAEIEKVGGRDCLIITEQTTKSISCLSKDKLLRLDILLAEQDEVFERNRKEIETSFSVNNE